MPRAALVALVLLLSACAGPPATYEAVHEYDPARDAAKDIDAALAEAARNGRRVLLEVGGAWCIWCHRLDAFWEQEAVNQSVRWVLIVESSVW